VAIELPDLVLDAVGRDVRETVQETADEGKIIFRDENVTRKVVRLTS
jgi:hypothetical protein